ncbi:ATP phosphoribosyltransferase [Bacillus marinisedimentorum]|uniref:ATP phosphoribosyltransferase n=1 Tax=Bacillus marinisedimentorum TaxID=1821260 RepID=UPI0007E26FB0|nr:ATP phosphoribosyltransferase [Bacillus marinisedimentorum]
MDEKLTIALPKGRIFKDAARLLQDAGYELPPDFSDTRKLIIESEKDGFRYILAKPMDVPTYVEYGVADVGIAGKDVMLEEERDVYEVLDLNISPCHLAVAGVPGTKLGSVAPKVATKYPNIASSYFRQQGEQVEIIKLNGSIELAPLVGLAERIVDIVSTGQTLKDNGLVEMERIVGITSRFIVNPVSYRTKDSIIDDMTSRLARAVKGSVGK